MVDFALVESAKTLMKLEITTISFVILKENLEEKIDIELRAEGTP